METKDLIIETAFLAFLENGYDRVSLNKIVKTTGLTKGAFYHNFSSKSELIHEVMSRYFFTHISNSVDLIEGSGDSFKDKLIKIYTSVLNVKVHLYAYPDIVVKEEAFMHLFQECMGIDDELKKMGAEQEYITMIAMQKAIEEAKANDEVKNDIDALDLAELINATIRGTMMATSYLSKAETEKILKKNIETLLSLIRQ